MIHFDLRVNIRPSRTGRTNNPNLKTEFSLQLLTQPLNAVLETPSQSVAQSALIECSATELNLVLSTWRQCQLDNQPLSLLQTQGIRIKIINLK